MTTYLLGPQRFLRTAGSTARQVAPSGTVATVTAGWRGRESDDAELDEALDGRSRNLRLYKRFLDVLATDTEFAAAALEYSQGVDEAAALYSLRLQRTLDIVYAVQRRTARPDITDSAVVAAIQSVRDVDAWYLSVVTQLQRELELTAPPEDSEVIQAHRDEIAEILADAAALAIAGGHVGQLLRCLKLFDVRMPVGLPVVAWSAGAMAITDHVVLYNDTGPEGIRGGELWDVGMGRVHGVIAMPHARRRLRLDDPARTRVFVRRFAASTCLLLDDGTRVRFDADGQVPDGARILTPDGTVGTVGDAA